MTETLPPPPSRTRLSQRDLRLLFYLGVPTLFGLSLGWQGAGIIAGDFSRPVSLVYWIGAAHLVWLSLEIGTQFSARIVPKGKTPLLIIVILGGALQPIIGRPMLSFWQSLFVGFLPDDIPVPPLIYLYTSISEYGRVLLANSFIISVWVAFNFLFDRFLGLRRFREATGFVRRSDHFEHNDGTVKVKETSGLLIRLPPHLGQDIIALSAEDHYVRVYTPEGNDLTLYRFSDAVREMPENYGLQVHRSHWVALSAIDRFEEAGRGYQLVLNETIKIPVSQRYIEVLKTRGIALGKD